MNLASAICAALACGVLTWVAADVTTSLRAGIFTGVLFAASSHSGRRRSSRRCTRCMC